MKLFGRARPRGLRPELPSAVPGTSMYPGAGQWGNIPLPLPSSVTVEGLPAASRARNMIANAVALMTPFQQWGPDGYLAEDSAAPILARPNVTFGLYDFYYMATAIAIMRGNFLALKADFDPRTGFPNQLVPVPTGYWLAYYDDAGYLVYMVQGTPYSREQVFHVRANALPNQPMGTGIVTQFRRALGSALDEQNFASDTYRSGSVPAGIINLDLPDVEQAQSDFVQNQWVTSHAGTRAPAVLPNTMKFEKLDWSPLDMQFLQARQFTVGEIAHMFNLDPTDLGAALLGDSMTYANIEQRQVQRTVDSYAQWMRRFEEEMSDCLPGNNVAKLVPANLQRTDTKTTAETDQLQVGTSMRSVDELRKRDGLKPLPYAHVPQGVTRVNPDGTTIDGPKMPAVDATGKPVAPDAANPVSGGGVSAPEPIPGTDIVATPVKVKE